MTDVYMIIRSAVQHHGSAGRRNAWGLRLVYGLVHLVVTATKADGGEQGQGVAGVADDDFQHVRSPLGWWIRHFCIRKGLKPPCSKTTPGEPGLTPAGQPGLPGVVG